MSSFQFLRRWGKGGYSRLTFGHLPPFNSSRSPNSAAAGFFERRSTFVLYEASEFGCPPNWLLRERYHQHNDLDSPF
jgi:hypothetical protein